MRTECNQGKGETIRLFLRNTKVARPFRATVFIATGAHHVCA
ncbi:hypothetical protein [Polaromonas sp. CG9_12]|nr:hypothetical protein [Polaromonas sp. CG9_12]